MAQSLSMQLWWHLAGLGDNGDFCNRALKQLRHGLCFSMDENYILLPHGVNFQEAIFPDTQENRRMFASLFQFSNCSQAQHALSFSSDWEIQEDNRVRDLFALWCLFSRHRHSSVICVYISIRVYICRLAGS